MQYIILDLEWNQPISNQSPVYRKVGDRLVFEMIQIGAVRVSERMEIIDSISIPIRPTWYQKIHPRIRAMTGLDPDVLADAVEFREAMDQFIAWCGDDYTLLTWGCDDVSVLQQNLDFFEYKADLPQLCDLQLCFRDIFQCKERMSLPAAMAMLEIEPEEDRSFHNAVHDAYYTARVFQHVSEPLRVLQYGQKPRCLIRPKTHPGDAVFDSLKEALTSDLALKPVCPKCSRVLELDGAYVKQSADKYVTLGTCRTHGAAIVRLRFRPMPDGKRLVKRSEDIASASTIAYVHTKRLQVQRKQEEWLKTHADLPDPEEELENAGRSSVEFEDRQ